MRVTDPDAPYRMPYPQGYLDFDFLPRRDDGSVYLVPTNVKILEQGGDVLIYRECHRPPGLPGGQVSPKQNAIFNRLVRMGEAEESDCRVTVLVVDGTMDPERRMAVYDHTNVPLESPVWRVASTETIQQWISDWFAERAHRRR